MSIRETLHAHSRQPEFLAARISIWQETYFYCLKEKARAQNDWTGRGSPADQADAAVAAFERAMCPIKEILTKAE